MRASEYGRTKELRRLILWQCLSGYVLVERDEPDNDSPYRHPGGVWRMIPASGLDRTIHLALLGTDPPPAGVFAGVAFPPADRADVD